MSDSREEWVQHRADCAERAVKFADEHPDQKSQQDAFWHCVKLKEGLAEYPSLSVNMSDRLRAVMEGFRE